MANRIARILFSVFLTVVGGKIVVVALKELYAGRSEWSLFFGDTTAMLLVVGALFLVLAYVGIYNVYEEIKANR